MGRTRLDLTGRQFGRLTVRGRAEDDERGKIRWHCDCKCGGKKTVGHETLLTKHTRSCGCLRIQISSANLGIKPCKYPAGTIYCKYRWNAERRGLQWALTKEETYILFQNNCHYCGEPPSNVYKKIFYSGIDRKDNRLGYTTENVVSCCKFCNRLKGTLHHDVFIKYLTRAGKYQINRQLIEESKM